MAYYFVRIWLKSHIKSVIFSSMMKQIFTILLTSPAFRKSFEHVLTCQKLRINFNRLVKDHLILNDIPFQKLKVTKLKLFYPSVIGAILKFEKNNQKMKKDISCLELLISKHNISIMKLYNLSIQKSNHHLIIKKEWLWWKKNNISKNKKFKNFSAIFNQIRENFKWNH